MNKLLLIGLIFCLSKNAFGQKVSESDSLDCVNLNNKVAIYFKNQKVDSAIALAKISIQKSKKTFGDFGYEYAVSLNNLGYIYNYMHYYKESEPLFKKASLINKKIFGENSLEYAYSLKALALVYFELRNYSDAEFLYKATSKIFKQKLGENHPHYINNIYDLVDLYEFSGNLYAAEPLHKQIIQIDKSQYGEDHPTFAISLNGLAVLYKKTGRYDSAEFLFEKIAEIVKTNYGDNDTSYATSLNNLAVVSMEKGNYGKAEFLYKQAHEIIRKAKGENHPSFALSLSNLAELYRDIGNYTAAESLCKQALLIRKKVLGKNHPDYAISVNNLALLYSKKGLYDSAKLLFKESYEIYKKLLGENHPNYATVLSNLAVFYLELGEYKEAEKLENEALVIRKKTLGESHPDYSLSMNNLVITYYNRRQFVPWQQLINTTIQIENITQQLLLKNFSESEKEMYLIKESDMQQAFLSMLHYFKPQATNSFYQSTTAKQGWLLQSKQQLIQFANQSKDTSVKNLLTQWQNINRQYAQAIQLTIEKRKLNNINVDSLQEQSQQLEKQLIAAMPALQAVIINNGFTGKQVAAKLKPKEAVVHWVSFQYKSPEKWTDSVLYAAYIITPNDTVPKLVTVFEEKQLQQILKNYHAAANARSTIKKDSSNNTNADIALYNLIWKPLLPYLQNATTVYNLPAGLLHKISFAALTDSSNKSLIDTYEIHQLLSINELVNPLKIDNKNNTIALFGGANYNAANTATTASGTIAQTPLYRNATNNSTNIQFNYLQGTKTEVETVAKNAKNTNWKTQSYIGTTATENNLKSIGGENAPKILHIATHGFYFPPTKIKLSNFITDDKNTPKDFPLLRSGLVLSGANNYWGKDTLLENQEDGIVTAQEISNLNLLNTDLVVLSACQTALGDINGSEGVYGLQRAFKMAGVKKLLMSLWEVPDAETAELMQLFYNHIFKGETYYTAFRKAQLTLKAKYKDPTKWAGFVLVGE